MLTCNVMPTYLRGNLSNSSCSSASQCYFLMNQAFLVSSVQYLNFWYQYKQPQTCGSTMYCGYKF